MLTRQTIRKAARLQQQVETAETGTFFGAKIPGSGPDEAYRKRRASVPSFYDCPAYLVAKVVENCCGGNMARTADGESLHLMCNSCPHYYLNR